MLKGSELRPQSSTLSHLPLMMTSYKYVVLNAINMPMTHIYISSPDLFPELYTHISKCLLHISKLKMSKTKLLICFPKLDLPAVFPITIDGNSGFSVAQPKNSVILDSCLPVPCTSDLAGINSTFKIHPESNHFSPPLWLPF